MVTVPPLATSWGSPHLRLQCLPLRQAHTRHRHSHLHTERGRNCHVVSGKAQSVLIPLPLYVRKSQTNLLTVYASMTGSGVLRR